MEDKLPEFLANDDKSSKTTDIYHLYYSTNMPATLTITLSKSKERQNASIIKIWTGAMNRPYSLDELS